MSRPAAIHRILIALDASPGSLRALEAAAYLASRFKAELAGIYIEDEILLRSAELPTSRVVGSFSGSVRRVERREIEQQLRTQAARARHALEVVAGRAALGWSFRVARGGVASELLAAAGEADLISLGRCGWSPVEGRRIGGTTRAVLGQTGAPVLLLPRALRPGRAVVAIYDGTKRARAGLRLGADLASDPATPLVVLLPAMADQARRLHDEAVGELEGSVALRNIRFTAIPRQDAATIAQAAGAEGIGLLILPGADLVEGEFKELLGRLECAALVMR